MVVNINPYTAMQFKNNISDTAPRSDTTAPKAAENMVMAPARALQQTQTGRHISYTTLLSKSVPKMSDEEFMNAAKEQARKDFSKGIRDEDEFHALRDTFISVVSPDRAGIVKNAVRNLQNSSGQLQPYILQWLNIWGEPSKDKDALGASTLVSGVTFTPSGEIHDITIHDSSGSPIAKYNRSAGGWIPILTPEEWERHHAILRAYNDEWYALHNEAKAENNRFELMQSDLGIGSFDAMG